MQRLKTSRIPLRAMWALVVRSVEVVIEHLVGHLRADLDAVVDRRAEVDAAPDASVADLVLQIPDAVEVTVAEAGQAGDGEVDVPCPEELGDDTSPGRGDAGVRARVLGMVRRAGEQRGPRRVADGAALPSVSPARIAVIGRQNA